MSCKREGKLKDDLSKEKKLFSHGYSCTELAFQAIPIGMSQVSGNEKMAFVFYPGKWYNEGNGTAKFNLVTGIDDAVDEGIKVHTISLGEASNSYIDTQIARTGGESFIATTTDELKELIQGYLIDEAYGQNTHEVETFDYFDSDGDGLYSICYSNPNQLTQAEIKSCVTRIVLQCDLVYDMFPTATKFLMQYIGNTEDRYYFDATKAIGLNSGACQSFANDVQRILRVAMQDYGREGTICLSLAPEVDGSGVSYPLWQLDYFYAIHFAETRPVVQITYDGEIYKMNLKYYIFDYYDWDENGDAYVPF